jgi:acyl transferase domain-containing protein
VAAAAALPLLHLRAVNPYVASSLDQLRQGAPGAALPKQPGPQPEARPHATIFGVSAFAFQGTNAHAVVQPAAASAAALHPGYGACRAAWKHCRMYVLPEAHLFVRRAAPPPQGRRQVVLQADLARPELAFLWDHQVMGKAIFPGETCSCVCALNST